MATTMAMRSPQVVGQSMPGTYSPMVPQGRPMSSMQMTGMSPNPMQMTGMSPSPMQMTGMSPSPMQMTGMSPSPMPSQFVSGMPTTIGATSTYPGATGGSFYPGAMSTAYGGSPTVVRAGPGSAPLMTMARGHTASNMGGVDFGTYRPPGAEYVSPGNGLSGGMVATYDMGSVPTFEAPLIVQTEPRQAASPSSHYEMKQRGVTASDVSETSSLTKSIKRSPKKPKKPEKKGWCC